MLNAEHEGYERVTDYIPIAQPNHSTLAKLAALEPSEASGDRERFTIPDLLARQAMVLVTDRDMHEKCAVIGLLSPA